MANSKMFIFSCIFIVSFTCEICPHQCFVISLHILILTWSKGRQMHFEKVLLCRFLNLHQLKNTALNLTSLAVCFVFFFCTSIKSHWFFQLYWQRNCFFLKSNLVVFSFASYITATLLKGLCVVEDSNVCSSLDIVRFSVLNSVF